MHCCDDENSTATEVQALKINCLTITIARHVYRSSTTKDAADLACACCRADERRRTARCELGGCIFRSRRHINLPMFEHRTLQINHASHSWPVRHQEACSLLYAQFDPFGRATSSLVVGSSGPFQRFSHFRYEKARGYSQGQLGLGATTAYGLSRPWMRIRQSGHCAVPQSRHRRRRTRTAYSASSTVF